MELSLDFSCPRCAGTFPVSLAELAPGQRRLCPACNVDLQLTDGALRAFRQALETACRP